MSSVVSSVVLSELCFPDITGKAIKAWGTVVFTPGVYTPGGIPFGLVQFADVRTVDFNGYLQCVVYSEEPVTATTNLYTYLYSPIGDIVQIFNRATGVELGNVAIPSAILSDVILFKATWDRTTVRG